MVFSDSQLRLIIQGDVPLKEGWFVSSTAGSFFQDLAEEVNSVDFKGAVPRAVVVLVGTNDMSRHYLLEVLKLLKDVQIFKISAFEIPKREPPLLS